MNLYSHFQEAIYSQPRETLLVAFNSHYSKLDMVQLAKNHTLHCLTDEMKYAVMTGFIFSKKATFSKFLSKLPIVLTIVQEIANSVQISKRTSTAPGSQTFKEGVSTTYHLFSISMTSQFL